LHHGLRGEEADRDLEFARELAARLGLSFHEARMDVAAEAAKSGETIEEAARRLRYGWFRELMAAGEVEAVATAHTLDDQAETVLAKFLRGAWTEGLSGIHPVVTFSEGRILRPLLAITRAEIEAYLRALGQDWRVDASNRHLTYTRNRIRHELLPLLESWNPRLREHLAQMAALACDEETWWQAEMARIGAQLLLPGRPVRGGGRAADGGVRLDVRRLGQLPAAMQRRLLRWAAEATGVAIDFTATEALRGLALTGKAGQRLELSHGLRAERSQRELQLAVETGAAEVSAAEEYRVGIPGEVTGFGVRLRIEIAEPAAAVGATLRNWRAGDRVWLRYSSGPRKVKEVLARLHVTGTGRSVWPVLEVDGRIVWMRGVEVEAAAGIRIAETTDSEDEFN
jgi:tRNA(Ile)-lysidine synthase